MKSFYSKEEDTYYIVDGEEVNLVGKAIAIGFSVNPDYNTGQNEKTVILHKHGPEAVVTKWYDNSINKMLAAGVHSFAEDLKMVVSSKIDTSDMNLILEKDGYLQFWLEKNNVEI